MSSRGAVAWSRLVPFPTDRRCTAVAHLKGKDLGLFCQSSGSVCCRLNRNPQIAPVSAEDYLDNMPHERFAVACWVVRVGGARDWSLVRVTRSRKMVKRFQYKSPLAAPALRWSLSCRCGPSEPPQNPEIEKGVPDTRVSVMSCLSNERDTGKIVS
jgi:hypothetical protein